MGLYDDVFAALEASGARYVVVGGFAVVVHGHARLTVDLDVVIDLAAEPAAAAIAALSALGLQPRLPVDPAGFADPATRQEWVSQRNVVVFSMYDPSDARREVDLFAVHPIPFEDLVAAAVRRPLAGRVVPVASIEHLIALKEAAGRPRDLDDIAALRRLREDGAHE